MITLRPHERADIPLRVKWLNNKAANTYLTDAPSHVTDISEQTDWFDRYEVNDGKRFYTVLADRIPVGFTGLSSIDNKKKCASIFIMIGEDEYRGKGIGKVILSKLLEKGRKHGVRSFTLDVFKDNAAARRLYTGLGFTETECDNSAMVSMVCTTPPETTVESQRR